MAPTSRSASVEVPGEAVKGETRPRRAFCSPEKLIDSPEEGVTTIHDVVRVAANRYPNKPMVGWRETIKVHEEVKDVIKRVNGKESKEKKTWQFYELSEYRYWTYSEFMEQMKIVGSGLKALGLGRETRFNIYSATGVNWQLMAQSCIAQTIPICTAYDTLGEEGLQHSLAEPDVVGVFTNSELLPMLTKVIGQTPTVKLVVYDGTPSEGTVDKLKAARPDLDVRSLDELRAVGKENPVDFDPPTADDVCCIMYTSGSTGAPKGVILTHKNLTSAVASVVLLLGHLLTTDDTYLAYLPLAHILEFIVECVMTYVGITLGFGKVKTLTDASVRNCVGDIRALRPSIMVGVPAVWELIRKGIIGKVNAGGSLKKTIFNGALSVKRNSVPILSNVVDSVVFSAVKNQTGGRLRYALSGGAPISRDTQEFLDLSLVTMLQGYGMTESCGMCAILTPEFLSYGPVGVPVPSIEIKLRDVADAGYLSTNNPPQGEILIRGPSVTKGYFKREDLTEEAITEDGWLITGDVGQWNKDGTLSVIDRVKNLVKLSGGEYIALERLESTYKSCPLVSNICVYANSDAKQPIAIIFPHEANLRAYLADKDILPNADAKHEELKSLTANPKVRAAVLKETNAAGAKAGFKPLERLQNVILTHEELPVTAAQKLQRKPIEQKFKDEIASAYKS